MGIFSSLFGSGDQGETEIEGFYVTAQLNHLLMPIDRGDRYEDPLHEVLAEVGLGETTGGGTMQKESGEIEYIDVDITLLDLEKGVPLVIGVLEKLGAPKGSILRVDAADALQEIPFGKKEGVGIYLDGVNLADEVYANEDINEVIAELDNRLEGCGEMQCHWEGPTHTALYFYGDSAKGMFERMKDYLQSHPLCKGAKAVVVAPDKRKD